MEASSVVVGLEVIEKRNGGGAFGVEGEAVAEDFRLKGSKGAFRKSVVTTIAFGAHALAQTMSGEQLAGDGGGVLAAAIRVKDCSRGTRPEWMALESGVPGVLLTHPHYPSVELSNDQLIQLTCDSRVFVEHCLAIHTIEGVPLARFADSILATGAQQVVLATDFGQVHSDPRPERQAEWTFER